MNHQQTRISASEVADFVYCRSCWYFRLRGLLPAKETTEAMLQGAAQHTHLSTALERHATTRVILLVMVAVAAVICVGLIVLGVMVH
jgi:CRISPR/Cas system-associated exonuclease Cas4 (RecB family)